MLNLRFKGKRTIIRITKNSDPLREKLDMLFAGKLGKPYSKEDLETKYGQAEQRLERRIPPGFKDEGKPGVGKYGDIILWFQMLDYAHAQKKPIIFITDDAKKDWWLSSQESQGYLKPRSELVQEMFMDSGVLFHMYQGYEFMEQAQRVLRLEEKPQIIEEAKEVAEQNALELDQGYYNKKTIVRKGFRAEDAVFEWLKEHYELVSVNYHANEGVDFVIEDNDAEWVRVGVEVKYKIEPFREVDIVRILDRLEKFKRLYSSFIVFLVCGNEFNAKTTLKNIRKYDLVIIDTLIKVGYMTSLGNFTEIPDTTT